MQGPGPQRDEQDRIRAPQQEDFPGARRMGLARSRGATRVSASGDDRADNDQWNNPGGPACFGAGNLGGLRTDRGSRKRDRQRCRQRKCSKFHYRSSLFCGGIHADTAANWGASPKAREQDKPRKRRTICTKAMQPPIRIGRNCIGLKIHENSTQIGQMQDVCPSPPDGCDQNRTNGKPHRTGKFGIQGRKLCEMHRSKSTYHREYNVTLSHPRGTHGKYQYDERAAITWRIASNAAFMRHTDGHSLHKSRYMMVWMNCPKTPKARASIAQAALMSHFV